MKKFINLLLISVILLSLTAVTGVNAAGTAFSISGIVIDRYGNPLPGADVTLIDNDFNTIQTKKTNENGNFDFINVIANTDTCTVRVSYTDSDGTKYEMPTYYARWYPTKSIQNIPSKETQIPNYPQPEYGYIYGAIQSGTGNSANFINGIVYLVSLDNDVKYYEFADRTDGKGSYTFYVPAGSYMLYAQHWENGVVYESTHKQVTVERNADIGKVLETRIILPLNTPSSNADPAEMPVQHANIVTGSVLTKDSKPIEGATVTLLQIADNQSGYIPMKGYDGVVQTTVTDSSGKYTFNGVAPTTNDGKSIQSKKNIKVRVEYTDLNNAKQTVEAPNSDYRPLYYPDVILGYGMENAARNVEMPAVVVPFAKGGWVKLESVPSGANIYVDGQQLFQITSAGKQEPLTTPATAYIDAGSHKIRMSKDGYQDVKDTITMEANTQHQDVTEPLQKAMVPAWVTLVVAIVILLIAVIAIIALLATRIKYLLAPLSKTLGNMKASREANKAHKAEAKQETARRETIKARPESSPRDDVDVVNVDPVKRKREPVMAEEGKKKKILDFDLKHIADSVPRKIKPREPVEAPKEKSPVVFANDIYKKTNSNVERYEAPSRRYEEPSRNYEAPPSRSYYEPPQRAQPVSEREALVERPTAPERNERFRIPRMSGQRDAGASAGDKDRVLRYIRDHPEGVSFIQMSNDLEIIPNNLTYITKELVINDDIEKVKGLYYYKSHSSSADDSSSSVVVWRLDGDK